jgi:hypothetical protein
MSSGVTNKVITEEEGNPLKEPMMPIGTQDVKVLINEDPGTTKRHVLEKIHLEGIDQKTYLYTEEECLEAIV